MSNYEAQLTRATNGYVGGVCEGMGRHFGVSPTLLRVLWIASVLLLGTGILLYLVLWWIIPREDTMPEEPVVWRKLSNGEHAPPMRRTAVDRKLFGVCGGLARRWGIDPSVMRLVVLSLATLSLGLVAIAYVITAMVMPGPGHQTSQQVYPVEF